MRVPRDQAAEAEELGDMQSCRVYVQMSSRGNSALLHREVNTWHSCGHGTPFLSPIHVDSLCQQISHLCLNSFSKCVSSELPLWCCRYDLASLSAPERQWVARSLRLVKL